MPWNAREIHGLLEECGALALSIQSSAERSIKSDNTIVTEADTRIEALVNKTLGAQEGVYLIGEETAKTRDISYHREALTGECYVTDPVDGTVLYANHLPGWGVSIGFMDKGVLSEGAIYFPVSGEIFISDGDTVLYGNSLGESCPVFEELKPYAPVYLDPPSPVINISQTMIKWGKYSGSYSALSTGSCVSSMQYLITGGSIAYVTRTRLWDLAAGFPLLKKLGHTAYFQDGREFPLDVTDDFWEIPVGGDEDMWRMKDHAVFCRDRAVFDTVLADCTIPDTPE